MPEELIVSIPLFASYRAVRNFTSLNEFVLMRWLRKDEPFHGNSARQKEAFN